MIKLVIDSVGTDAGNAFVYCAPDSPIKDICINGRIGRTDAGVYLETYSSTDLGYAGAPFPGVRVEASSRKIAVVKMLVALGYPRGTEFSIRYERN